MPNNSNMWLQKSLLEYYNSTLVPGTQDTCFKDNNINVLQYLRAQSLPHDTTPCKKYILPFLHISGPPLSPLKTKYIYSL